MEAKGFGLPSAFWRAMAEETPELVLLDIMLPEEDGLEILRSSAAARRPRRCRSLCSPPREQSMTRWWGWTTAQMTISPSRSGMMALVARIKAVLRRTEKPVEEKVLRLGELSVNPTRHVVQVSGETVNLTLKEFELLCLLLDNPGVVFTRDQLLNQIWGYSFDGESRTVDVHVRHLRRNWGTAATISRPSGHRLSFGGW